MSGILVIFLSFFILAFNFRNGYASENKGDWVPREGPNSIALAIGTGHRSWSVSQNMELCERSRIFVPFRADFPDYTETISLALKTLQSFGGGSLQLGMGSYPVSAPIEMLSNTCIMGVRPDVTFIKLLDKAASFGSKAGLLRANKVENIFVGNLTVDGNKASQDATNQVEKGKRAGIQFTLANYVYMRNVAIENNPGNGLNIRGEGNDSYSSHISLEKVHVFENGGDAISFSKAAYVSLSDSSVGKNRRHGITLSSSKHALLRDISIKGNEGAKTCGIALRDSTHDVLVEKVSIENATQAGICARDTIGVMVKFSTIENLQSNQASCYHVRTTTGFDEQGNTCRVVSDQEFNTDESITTGLQPSTPSRKPSTTDSPAPAYVIITMGGV